jgi:hypothetical protein
MDGISLDDGQDFAGHHNDGSSSETNWTSHLIFEEVGYREIKHESDNPAKHNIAVDEVLRFLL